MPCLTRWIYICMYIYIQIPHLPSTTRRRTSGPPCFCPTGYEGIHCEFQTGTVPSCTLNCQNGGICTIGIQSPDEVSTVNHLWTAEEIQAHMYCVCPTTRNFSGPLCDVPAQTCGGVIGGGSSGSTNNNNNNNTVAISDRQCYYGGTCVTTTITNALGSTIDQYHCDCSTAHSSTTNRIAGTYCQYQATAICDVNNRNLFCVNGGSCNMTDPSKPCLCPPGFSGTKVGV